MSDASTGPFNPRLVIGLVAAGILAFLAFLVLTAFAGNLGSGRDGRAHALSVGATGFQGLVRLVGYTDGATRMIRSESDAHSTDDLIVVAVEPRTEAAALKAFVDARGQRPTLLILPKWNTVPVEGRRGWVHDAGVIDPGLLSGLVKELDDVAVTAAGDDRRPLRGIGILNGMSVPTPGNLHALKGSDIQPLIVNRSGDIVLGKIAEWPLYLLADPDLLNNQGLKDPARASAAVDMVNALNVQSDMLAFDLTINGFGSSQNILQLAFEPPFLALTIALLLAALLAGLQGAFRFGPERREEREIALGKAALVENSAALIRLARREHRAGSAYAELIREAAASAAAAPAGVRGAELDAYLDRLTKPGEPNFSSLAGRVRRAANRDALASAGRDLFQWKKDNIR